MDFHLSAGCEPVTKSHAVPPHYRHHRMRGARSLYVQGSFGDYLTQIITCKGFSIQYNVFTILKAIWLYPFVLRSLVTLHFTLDGKIRCLLKGFGKAWLIPGFYHLFFVPGGAGHKARLKPGHYLSFHIDLTCEFLQILAVKYPELQEVTDRVLQGSSDGVQEHAAHITPEIIRIIHEIQYCPEDEEPDKSWYLETRIRELLWLYVKDRPPEAPLLAKAVQQLEELKAYMLTHLDKPLTTALLARQWGLRESTLRSRFARHFGVPLRTFLHTARMKAAMDMVEHEIPLGDIAIAVGYSDISNFSRAFKQYYQHPPSHFRHR